MCVLSCDKPLFQLQRRPRFIGFKYLNLTARSMPPVLFLSFWKPLVPRLSFTLYPVFCLIPFTLCLLLFTFALNTCRVNIWSNDIHPKAVFHCHSHPE